MLKVYCSDNCFPEKEYILNFIFDKVLGIPYKIIICEIESFSLMWNNDNLKIPSQYLENEKNIIEFKKISWTELIKNGPNLNYDLIGFCFYYLSRIEEYHFANFDKHKRVTNINLRNEIPIIDIVIEYIWEEMKSHLCGISRKKLRPRKFITCDVDRPYLLSSSTLSMTLRKMAGDLLKRRSLKEFCLSFLRYWDFKLGKFNLDPYYQGLKYIMSINEEAKNKVAFYFICGHRNDQYDTFYSLEDLFVTNLMKEILDRGHEVGIHGSYETFQDIEQLSREFNCLRQKLKSLGIKDPVIGGRQHYLRWDSEKTARIMESAGIAYDSTLGFAEKAGFRCGTSHEFQMYDLKNRKPLKLRQRPLIVMETSIISDMYMGLGYTEEALGKMLELKEKCFKYGGCFTLLWHNSHFTNEKDKYFYEKLIK